MGHTPGPWEVMVEINTPFIGKKYPGGFKAVAHTYSVSVDDEERLANARLIAAAPDLLEALKNIISFHQSPGLITDKPEKIAVELAEQAIAKATGGRE